MTAPGGIGGRGPLYGVRVGVGVAEEGAATAGAGVGTGDGVADVVGWGAAAMMVGGAGLSGFGVAEGRTGALGGPDGLVGREGLPPPPVIGGVAPFGALAGV